MLKTTPRLVPLVTQPSNPRFQEPKVDLEKIYTRFTKPKREITIQDLQKEIKDTKSEARTLRQELIILRNPIQQETEYDHQLLVLTKEFIPDMDMLEKDFNSEKNRIKREAYRANHTREQKVEVLEKWKLFMKEVKADYPFFECFEKHFIWHKKNCVKSKTPTKPISPAKARHSKKKVENPVSPSPEVNVLEAHISSSSSNEPSLESEKEKEPLDDQLGDTPPLPPRIWKSKYRGNPAFKDFHRERIVSREYRRQKLEARGIYRKGNTLKLLKPRAKGKCFKCFVPFPMPKGCGKIRADFVLEFFFKLSDV